jgi:hypothetical protein
MTLRDELLAENHGDINEAASRLALALTVGDPDNYKAGYSIPNAILAAQDVFPEVDEDTIRNTVNARGTHPDWSRT